MEESCTERHDPSRVVGLQLMYVWYMYEGERGEANESVGEGEKKTDDAENSFFYPHRHTPSEPRSPLASLSSLNKIQ